MTVDPDWLAKLHGECFPDSRTWSREEFKELLAAPGCYLSQNEHGFALGCLVVDEAEILTIAVCHPARRRGIGRALLISLEQTLAQQGATRIFLEVDVNNRAAIAMYEAAGYRESGRRKSYYKHYNSPPSDALILSRTLR